MSTQKPFLIYNASAGSGKTFTLVKAYLKILFKSSNPIAFKNILAITFTNKAAGEMKSRIIDSLKSFSDEAILENPSPMFKQLCDELNINPNALHEKSTHILNAIIHNYAAFDISTIDGFTHKVIRTFAKDLKLPLNFEVELDVNSLLHEAVDRLISQAGFDKQLTKTLIEFAIEKADDDKSWDVSRDFNNISKLLVKENDIPFLQTLKDKTLDDFKALKKNVSKQIQIAQDKLISIGKDTLTFIDESGLQFNDFSSGSLPKYFEKLSEATFNLGVDLVWQTKLIEGDTLYPKRVTSDIAAVIDSIQPELGTAFNDSKTLIIELQFLKAIYKNLTPLSVLNEIQKELLEIKNEQNVMLISEFNSIISDEIKDQPTPFIYERIGEKFKHYFIDEFQDTSTMQWENIVSLLENSLSTVNGSVMLVGDAKQAIYRWRGGKAEQFIDLYNQTVNPFQTKPEIISLKSNFRSFKEIISFNNGLFNYLSNTIFSDATHQNLYENATQLIESDKNGYVELTFLDFETDDDKNLCYSKLVHEKIISCINEGFPLTDICILVRKKKEGIAIADYLTEQGLNIMSSETLLLNNSKKVQFINNTLRLLLQPTNQEIKVAVLLYITELCNITDKHAFLKLHIGLEITDLFKSFENLGFKIEYNQLLQLSLYDLIETLIREFKLIETSDAYLQYYMDVALNFSQKQLADISSFIDYYDSKSDKLSIVTPSGFEAIQIMTVHKSKGLEFPVVIFPFADLDIYRELSPQEWFPINPEVFNGFSQTLLNYGKSFENFGHEGKSIHNRHQSELELDNLNILYVALTRPIEQLYIISKRDINTKGVVNPKTYAGFFISYLQQNDLWEDQESIYSFGERQKESESQKIESNLLEENTFISSPRESHNINVITKAGYLWDTTQEKAIEKGNLIHHIMSLIKTEDDIDFVFTSFINNGTITNDQALILKQIVFDIVQHPKLKSFYQSENRIYNERDIISSNGNIHRLDRLVINANNEAVIIDYKSGQETKKHEYQLNDYESILMEMNFKVIKKILVYINDTIHVKEF